VIGDRTEQESPCGHAAAQQCKRKIGYLAAPPKGQIVSACDAIDVRTAGYPSGATSGRQIGSAMASS